MNDLVNDPQDFIANMIDIRNACHQNSKDKGFWDEGETDLAVDQYDAPNIIKTKPWSFGEKIALIHSELSEMFEAWRKNTKECDKNITIFDPSKPECGMGDGMRPITAIEEEVADVFIRMFDLCAKLSIDVGRVILAKMEYNSSRPHMHGGRKC